MKLDFSTMEEKQILSFKGGEGVFRPRMFTDPMNKILYGQLDPGCSIGYHTHDTDCEIVYMLEGRARMLYDGTEEVLLPGECSYCPKGHAHSLINDGPEVIRFFAVVAAQP